MLLLCHHRSNQDSGMNQINQTQKRSKQYRELKNKEKMDQGTPGPDRGSQRRHRINLALGGELDQSNIKENESLQVLEA